MKRDLAYFIRRFILVVLSFSAVEIFAQELDKESKIVTIERITNLLNEHYVFPEAAKKCGDHIKAKLNSGAFDNINNKEEFASALTKELQSISKDKHMRVRLNKKPEQQIEEDPFLQQFISKQQTRDGNFGFDKIDNLEGNIGYLDLRNFVPVHISKKIASSAMNLLMNSDALIIDLRKNKGGSPDLIQFICSYFFDKPTHLNSLYWKEGNKTEEFWTSKIENNQLTSVPIFVLTSSSTFSGGEEFANNLKTQKRALIIGETTGGGANPGGMFRVDDNFGIFIPTGRAINPITNSNWEGVGVEPDVKTTSEEALNVALVKAKLAAEEYREMKKQKIITASKTIRNNLKEAEKIIISDQNKGDQIISNALDQGISSGILDEDIINIEGYEYLLKDKVEMAIAIFKYNVKKYPGSSNVYDSLGEAYMKGNNNDLAISNYKKSLELNPDNKNAEEMIKKIQK